jgi:hypothetical protein
VIGQVGRAEDYVALDGDDLHENLIPDIPTETGVCKRGGDPAAVCVHADNGTRSGNEAAQKISKRTRNLAVPAE